MSIKKDASEFRKKLTRLADSIQHDGLIQAVESNCDEKECPDCQLSATIHLFGMPHHVTLVQVINTSKSVRKRMKAQLHRLSDLVEQYDGQMPVGLSHWYDALINADPGGNFQTVEVPGYKGEYVLIVTPYQK